VITAHFPAVSTARDLESEWNSTVLPTSASVNVPAHTVKYDLARLDLGIHTAFFFHAVA